MVDFQLQIGGTLAGVSFRDTRTISGKSSIVREESIPAAKAGVLTTRTSSTVGDITMDPGHGFVFGDIIDLFFSNGQGYRRGVGVTAVVGNLVSIATGVGLDLPAAAQPIYAMKPVRKDFMFAGADAQALVWDTEASGLITLVDASNVVISLRFLPNADQVDFWYLGKEPTSPVGSSAVDGVYFSHGDPAAAKIMTCGVLIN